MILTHTPGGAKIFFFAPDGELGQEEVQGIFSSLSLSLLLFFLARAREKKKEFPSSFGFSDSKQLCSPLSSHHPHRVLLLVFFLFVVGANNKNSTQQQQTTQKERERESTQKR